MFVSPGFNPGWEMTNDKFPPPTFHNLLMIGWNGEGKGGADGEDM